MKGVFMAVFTAVGLIMAGPFDAQAGDRRPPNSSQRAPLYTDTRANPDPAKFERRCLTLSCGTRWCYNVRR